MDWRAANDQQDEARWRVFLMFVVMALMVIRTGLMSRGVIAVLSTESASPDAAWVVNHQSRSASPADLNQAILALLCLAEAAGRLVIVKERAVWELMNQPLPRPAQEQPLSVDTLCESPEQRLDTS
ncbi:MAG: hypothetical protein AB7P20_16260 [Rhizobiaceae bacterium]